MKQVTTGAVFTTERVVSSADTAAEIGSGEAKVLSTPILAAVMENAAMCCAAQFLDEGETTVGTYIAIEHLSATPVGMSFSATATLTEANGRELVFEIEASDERGIIGKASHKRFVVLHEKFQAKVDAKKF